MQQERMLGKGMRTAGLAAGAALALWLLRGVIAALAAQLLAAYLLMGLALPLCRALERRMSPGAAAGLSLLGLGAGAVLLLLAVIPSLAAQLRQVSAAFPGLLRWAEAWLGRSQEALARRGIDLEPVRAELVSLISSQAGELVSSLAGAAARLAQALGKVFLAPLIAFYLLRDRRKITSLLLLALPVRWRMRAVRAAREMRRETAGFLRGQMLVSLAVAGLTAAALLAVGTPGWLLLGLLMGVLELVPYVGPLLAGIPAVLLALQGGLWQAAWTVAALLAVQQAEGSFLSPRLLSGATRLHPLTVLLAVSAGGILWGTTGMLLAVPVVVSIRGALRGLRT